MRIKVNASKLSWESWSAQMIQRNWAIELRWLFKNNTSRRRNTWVLSNSDVSGQNVTRNLAQINIKPV